MMIMSCLPEKITDNVTVGPQFKPVFTLILSKVSGPCGYSELIVLQGKVITHLPHSKGVYLAEQQQQQQQRNN